MTDIAYDRHGVVLLRATLADSRASVPVFVTSDIHFDSPHCDRALLRRHMEQAAARGAGVIINGDLFDAMQGQSDPRRSYAELRPEYQGRNDYFNAIVDDTAAFLRPYLGQGRVPWVLITRGNHETAVRRKSNIDLVSVLTMSLRDTGAVVLAGEYEGWLRVRLHVNRTKSLTCNIYWHHGRGGSAPVTRGVIDTARQAVYLPDADIVLNGHNHHGWIMPVPRLRIGSTGPPYQDICYYLRTPGYKRGDGEFERERIPAPKPRGGIWLDIGIIHDRRKTPRLRITPVLDIV